MKKNTRYLITGLAAAAGLTGAYFGVRALTSQRRHRQVNYQFPSGSRDWTQPDIPERRPEQPVGAHVEGTRYQPHDQPDRMPVPATGSTAPAAELMTDLTAQPVEVTQLASTLVQYLLGFNDMIVQLHARRRSGEGNDARSLLPADRTRFQETLDRLDNQLADIGEGNLEDGSLQGRIYRLIVKVRDALQNFNFTDDDLFRINGEVRSEACSVMREIQLEDLDFVRVRQAYACEE